MSVSGEQQKQYKRYRNQQAETINHWNQFALKLGGLLDCVPCDDEIEKAVRKLVDERKQNG